MVSKRGAKNGFERGKEMRRKGKNEIERKKKDRITKQMKGKFDEKFRTI